MLERIANGLKRHWVAVALVVGALVIGLGTAFTISYIVMPIRTSHVENLVIDLNGDGQLDFVVSAEVILNNSVTPLESPVQ